MQEAPEICAFMPKGYIRTLAKRTKMTDPSAIAKLVNYQQHKSPNWPEVLKLAQETDPEGFAAWAADNPEKVPAPVAA